MREKILFLKRKYEKYRNKLQKEQKVLVFFAFLFFILLARLFSLQVVQGKYRGEVLLNQHYTKSNLHAERGNIYVTDRAGKPLQLTENVEYFNLYVDPKFVLDKAKVIESITPIIYTHLCKIYGLENPTKYQCLQHLEKFTRTEILPKREGVFFSSGDQQYYLDTETYEDEIESFLSGFSEKKINDLIAKRLETLLEGGVKERNYLGFFDNDKFLEEIQNGSFPYLEIQDNYYVYINPKKVSSVSKTLKTLSTTLEKYGFYFEKSKLQALLQEQEKRYVKLTTNMNAKVAKMFKDEKRKRYDDRINHKTRGDLSPLLHGFGLEKYGRRYYPYGKFMSHLLGYVDKKGTAYYGIEQYFDKELAGKEGKLIGLATPRIGQVGANSFDVENAEDGVDVYLTIDPIIQKELESWVRYYHKVLIADSVAVTILDPNTGEIKAMANSPDFNPNHPEEIYKLKPLTYDERYIIEDLTRIDIPVFFLTGGNLHQALVDERQQAQMKKYIFKNYRGPQTFINKNIAYPYEPGSVFKTLTLAIGMDSDAFSMYDFYEDPGLIHVGPYTIANISRKCKGEHTYLHALEFSCNVGLVRMAQSMTKYIFYSYLKKLGFGKLTSIELAGEERGTLPDFNTVSLARFFNNVFGEGILATPLQVAVAYAAAVNGGMYIQPTIVKAIYDPNKKDYLTLSRKQSAQVFKPSTSKNTKDALVSVIDNGQLGKVKKPGFSLGGKTGTSEITFKGKYKGGHGRTNGSFVGIVTAKETKYVVAVQVRRPRSSPWGLDTAGKVFASIADFLLAYDKIEE